MCVLVSEIFAGIIRLLHCVNWGFIEMRWFPWWFLRLSLTIPITLGIMSTAAISIQVYHLHEGTNNPSYRRTKRHRMFVAISYSLAMVLLLDSVHFIYVAYQNAEIIDSSLIALLYAFVQMPISIAFVRFGYATGCMMLQQAQGILPEPEIQRRKKFSNRVKLSGFAMMLNNLSFVAFALVADINSIYWNVGFFCLIYTGMFISTFQIQAIRTPSSSHAAAHHVVQHEQNHKVAYNMVLHRRKHRVSKLYRFRKPIRSQSDQSVMGFSQELTNTLSRKGMNRYIYRRTDVQTPNVQTTDVQSTDVYNSNTFFIVCGKSEQPN